MDDLIMAIRDMEKLASELGFTVDEYIEWLGRELNKPHSSVLRRDGDMLYIVAPSGSVYRLRARELTAEQIKEAEARHTPEIKLTGEGGGEG